MPRIVRYASKGPKLGPMVRSKVVSVSKFSASEMTTPPSTSPCPAKYFVALWITMLAPSSSGRISIGVAKVLSTISGALAFAGRGGNFVERAHAQQGIGDGLDHHGARLGFGDGCFERGEIADVGESCFDAEGSEDGHQHVRGGAVDDVAGDHALGAVDQRG